MKNLKIINEEKLKDWAKEIFKKLDNFLECIYLAPNIFPNENW